MSILFYVPALFFKEDNMNRKDTQELKKYRHIIAAMIDTSIGYFTPLMALGALRAHRENRDCHWEWYIDIVEKRYYGIDRKDIPKDAYKKVNHDVISISFRHRHQSRKRYQACLEIVDRNINGNESIGASWF